MAAAAPEPRCNLRERSLSLENSLPCGMGLGDEVNQVRVSVRSANSACEVATPTGSDT